MSKDIKYVFFNVCI